MRIALIVVIVVAGLFAAGVFYFLLQYLDSVQVEADLKAEAKRPGVESVDVLVAEIDLPAGTVVASEHVDWQAWPDDSVGDYIVYREDDDDADEDDLEEQVYDMIVRRAIMAGEPVTLSKLFVREGATFLSGMLAPGMRAVAIRVGKKAPAGVGGFIMPGDYVDVIVTIKWKIDSRVRDSGMPFTEYTSETVVQNARVMGVDQSFGDVAETAVKVDLVTIEVTPKQAEVLVVARGKGDLSLSLRSLQPGDTGVFVGFTSDRESLYAMGGDFPITDRLTNAIEVVSTDDATRERREFTSFPVITAVRDLPAGTLLRPRDIEWATLATGLSPEVYIIQGREWVGPSELAGVLLTADVKAGEPLLLHSLLSPEQSEFIAAALRPGMRAASLRGLGSIFVGTPGDEVDVVLSGEVEGHRFR